MVIVTTTAMMAVATNAAGSVVETLTAVDSTAEALEVETEAATEAAGVSEVAAAVERMTTCPIDTLSMKTKPSKLRLLTNNLKEATTKVATISAPTTAVAILNPNLLMALPALKVTITALRTISRSLASLKLSPGTMRPLSSELSLLLLSRNFE
jgi:hypothetical protein